MKFTAFFMCTVWLLVGCNENNATTNTETIHTLQQAFPLTVTQQQNALAIAWDLPQGIYLYQAKVAVVSLTPDAKTPIIQQPEPTFKQDLNTQAMVPVYRGQTTLQVALESTKAQPVDVEIRYQGCSDQGLCYPPQILTQTVNVTPMPIVQPSLNLPPAMADQVLLDLTNDRTIPGLIPLASDEPLSSEQAFQLSTGVIDGRTVFAQWRIAPDYYLYQDKTVLSVSHPAVSLGKIEWPPGVTKEDPEFGTTVVYHDDLSINIPLQRTAVEATQITLNIEYQGCAEILGICYPPQTKSVVLSLPALAVADVVPTKAVVLQSEQDTFYEVLANRSFFAVIALFFLAGLGLSLTPCVYPMLPILSGIIAKQKDTNTRKALILTLTYVLSVAVVFSTAGVIAALAGANVQAAFQDPWVIGVFCLVFVALSLSMFGFYELQLPSTWQNKLNNMSSSQEGGTLMGAVVMGGLSALIVSPCVTPPLAGALLFVSKSGDPLLGGLALFSLSIGMSVPLLILGVTEGSLLPKAGHWMNAVKAIFGVLMLGIAIWLLSRVVPASVILGLWGILSLTSSIYLGALEPLSVEATGWQRLWKGTGIVLLVYGVMLLVGAASQHEDVFAPLASNQSMVVQGGSSTQPVALHNGFVKVSTQASFKQALMAAQQQQKIALVDLYADWCVYCKDLDRTTFADPLVQQKLQAFHLIKLDITTLTADLKQLLAFYEIGFLQPPIQLFIDRQGNELKHYRVIGYQGPKQFLRTLDNIVL